MSTRFKGKLDERKIKLLAEIGCTQAEIAAVLEVSDDVISKHYSQVVEQGKQHCRASLRRMLWVSARNGNVTAQIWLSKQYCGFRDNPPDDGRDRPPVVLLPLEYLQAVNKALGFTGELKPLNGAMLDGQTSKLLPE